MPQLSLSTKPNGEQRVQVIVHDEQGLHRTTHFLMHEYLNLVDWKGLEQSSTERRCKTSVKKSKRCRRSPTAWAGRIELKKLSRSSKLRKAIRRQTTRGPTTRRQKPSARGNQMQARWSFAAEAWLQVTCGILLLTC